jgi:uncharacterized protein (DUF58 family)
MIVPGKRLLTWATVAVPVCAVGILVDGAGVVALALCGILVGIVVVDAVTGKGRLRSVVVNVPDIVRTSKEKETEIPLQIVDREMRGRRLAIGVQLPSHILQDSEFVETILPAGHPAARIALRCRPQRRGSFKIERFFIQTPSPMGLWDVRGSAKGSLELRVYPNLRSERRQLAAVFLRRGMAGIHAHRMIGKGREFEKLREYIRGDSFEDVHWKATAKRGKPVTKVFQIERTQELYVVLDASRMMAKPRGEASTLDRYISCALALGLVTQQQGDLFGMLTFSDKIHRFIRAGSGSLHYNACRDAVYTLEPGLVNPDFDAVTSFIRLHMNRRALLVFLTDLSDPLIAEGFLKSIPMISRKHVVLVNMMKEPGVEEIFRGAEVGKVDDLYGRLAGHTLWCGIKELENKLRQYGVQMSQVESPRMSTHLVSQYVSIKRRQLL